MLAILRCPQCGSTLGADSASADDVDRLACASCGSRWPVRFGIPDLRAEGTVDPYITLEEDLRAAERLFERARTDGFTGALAAYYETNTRVSPAQARRFIAATMASEERSRAVLASWRAWAGGPPPRVILDNGCGTGPLLVAAQSPGVTLIGADVGLRWLVLAAARLRDRGATAHLACAGAQRLPFASDSVDLVASESLLENVPPAKGALAEMSRVLRPSGRLCLTTANRWSVGPDPHVGLPLGGWLPGRMVAAYATRRGMVPPRRQLLSAGDLRRLLSMYGLAGIRIGPPPIADAQLRGASTAVRLGVAGYRIVERIGAGRAMLSAIGPSLMAFAEKPNS